MRTDYEPEEAPEVVGDVNDYDLLSQLEDFDIRGEGVIVSDYEGDSGMSAEDTTVDVEDLDKLPYTPPGTEIYARELCDSYQLIKVEKESIIPEDTQGNWEGVNHQLNGEREERVSSNPKREEALRQRGIV